jgi:phosphotransferase system IIA component
VTEDEDIKINIVELNGKLTRMMDGIDTVKEKQELMADDISKIKEAVYDPDQGIYARLRELESWKTNQSRLMWVILTSVVGITTAALMGSLF